MRRSLIALLMAFMLAALLPSAALAAKPSPQINVNCAAVVAVSDVTWSVSGTASWTGQPGGTTAVPYAMVVHTDGVSNWMTGYHDSSFTTVKAKQGSMTIHNVWIQSSWLAQPGDAVELGVQFVAKNGTVKGFSQSACSDALPPLMPS